MLQILLTVLQYAKGVINMSEKILITHIQLQDIKEQQGFISFNLTAYIQGQLRSVNVMKINGYSKMIVHSVKVANFSKDSKGNHVVKLGADFTQKYKTEAKKQIEQKIFHYLEEECKKTRLLLLFA
jgi:microsomal dipeptidase-like Zn-dependent dipeptidase